MIAGLVADEHAPHLTALRYKGFLPEHAGRLEAVRDLQRQDDAPPDEAAKREFRKQIPGGCESPRGSGL